MDTTLQYSPIGRIDDPRPSGVRVQDRILLLALMWRLSQHGYIGDPIKVQKTVFLAEYEAGAKGSVVFRYPYFRWDYGPFSKELRNDCRLLSDTLGYMEEGDWYVIRPDGSSLAEAFWLDVLADQRNRSIRELLEDIAKSCAQRPGGYIQKRVYGLTVPSAPPGRRRDVASRTVSDTPKGYDFLLLPARPKCQTFLPYEWEEVLAVELAEQSEARDSLRRAENDFRTGRVRVGDPIPPGLEE